MLDWCFTLGMKHRITVIEDNVSSAANKTVYLRALYLCSLLLVWWFTLDMANQITVIMYFVSFLNRINMLTFRGLSFCSTLPGTRS